MKKSATTIILWIVYILLLLVLLPHTAWAFKNWEPLGVQLSEITSYAAAFAFEAAIATLTHKLAKHIEDTKVVKTQKKNQDGTVNMAVDKWATFLKRYVNAFSFGLVIVTAVSALANLAHAVEFGRTLKIFTEWGISQKIYSLAFGGILPLVSLVFARVLSNVSDDEDAPNPELDEARKTLAAVRKQLHETEQRANSAERKLIETEQRANSAEGIATSSEERANSAEEQLQNTVLLLRSTEDRANLAEQRLGALGDVVRYLFGEDRRQRIIFARNQWKELPNSAIAIIAGASPSYVSEVLNSVEEVTA